MKTVDDSEGRHESGRDRPNVTAQEVAVNPLLDQDRSLRQFQADRTTRSRDAFQSTVGDGGSREWPMQRDRRSGDGPIRPPQRRQAVQDARCDHEAASVRARRADRGAAHRPGAVRLPRAGPALLHRPRPEAAAQPGLRRRHLLPLLHASPPRGSTRASSAPGRPATSRGPSRLLAAVEDRLGTVAGETTADGQVSLTDGPLPGRLRARPGRRLRRRSRRQPDAGVGSWNA